jgi:glycosyltransferase involved in cell wall biosynthesis
VAEAGARREGDGDPAVVSEPRGRVAFLAHTPLLPPISGERIRNWSLLRETAGRGWSVSLFFLEHGDVAPSAGEYESLAAVCDDITSVRLARDGGARTAKVLADAALRRPFHRSFFADDDAISACRRWLDEQRPDLIVAETHYTAPYVPNASLARTVFDTHNAETRRLASMARSLGLSPKGVMARLQRGPVSRFEQDLASRTARVVVVSEMDRSFFEPYAPGRVDVVPNGVDCSAIAARDEMPDEPTILFLGSLDYSANVEALAHFVDAIAPLLEHRAANLSVVGSNPRQAVYEAARRCSLETEVAATVPDTSPYWDAARCLIVPLRVGGGTRLKILEALARGVPVVTTSLGCEGLSVVDGSDVLVADTDAAFAAAVDRLLVDDETCRRLAAHGRATVERLYDWRVVADAFDASLDAALSRSS